MTPSGCGAASPQPVLKQAKTLCILQDRSTHPRWRGVQLMPKGIGDHDITRGEVWVIYALTLHCAEQIHPSCSSPVQR